MQEFIYYTPKGIDFPLPEHIQVTDILLEDSSNCDYIVSNSKEINAEVVANEIDFYVNNSKDSIASKIKNIEKLYEINAVKFDLGKDISYKQEVGNRLLLICSNEEKDDFVKQISSNEFDLFHVNEELIKEISGYIGNLIVNIEDEKEVELNVDQIVWFKQSDEGEKLSGCFNPNKTSLEDVLAQIRANIQDYEYKKYTVYDSSICQYHERREEICGRCEAVCPTNAITKIDEQKHLEFSQIDCVNCGECVSICPSGSLDYAPQDRDSIYHMSSFYKDTHPLIVSSKINLHKIDVQLKENVLPFMIDAPMFLDESSLLTITQMSGSQVIYFCDTFSNTVLEAIRIINDIYQKKYKKDAILVATNEQELEEAMDEVSLIENSFVNYNQQGQRKREVFSYRLEKLVGNDDLGIVKTGENIHYAKVKVNDSNCTLCLSCVGSCNVDALSANADDNTLRLNPSICTGCGYCEVSCPENDCLTIQRDIIELNQNWFKEEVLAKDTLFACIECGKEFATTKAVEKIANIMKPIFAADPVKQRTLYCCEDCKAKLMIKQGLLYE